MSSLALHRVRRPSPSTYRRIAVYGLPALITLAWLLYVSIDDQWPRVFGHWRASVTMVFASFVSGATPQGGGAVAFPVFTKLLGAPAPVARTFGISIQAVGMTVAAVIIVIAGRPIEVRAALAGGLSGIAGFLAALFLLGDPDTPFWSSTIPGPYVKVTFTVVLAAMSYIVVLSLRSKHRGASRIPHWNIRVWCGLCIAGFVGGIASALTGSGVNVFVFLFIVVMAGLHPRVGIPTCIVAMAMVSVIGFLVLGLAHGELYVLVDAQGDVYSVGGRPVDTLPGGSFDVLGFWLASIPIVVWGAPLGTYVAHVLREEQLIVFVGLMAAAEVISTAIFLDELRHDGMLVAYALGGLAVALVGVRLLAQHRRRLLALPAVGEHEGAAVTTR